MHPADEGEVVKKLGFELRLRTCLEDISVCFLGASVVLLQSVDVAHHEYEFFALDWVKFLLVGKQALTKRLSLLQVGVRVEK